jgi:hypothetical protein
VDGFSKNNSISNFVDIRPVVADILPIAEEKPDKRCEIRRQFL